MTADQKINDLGIIEVVDGQSSSHVLADGRTYVLTPTILPGRHQIQLETRIAYTNVDGSTHVFTMTTFFNPNQTTIYSGESNSLISVNLHLP